MRREFGGPRQPLHGGNGGGRGLGYLLDQRPSDHGTGGVLIVAGLLLGPSVGNVVQGSVRGALIGEGLRAGGVGLATGGFAAGFMNDRAGTGPEVAMLGGLVVFTSGVLYEASPPDATRGAWPRRHRSTAKRGSQLASSVSRSGAGHGLGWFQAPAAVPCPCTSLPRTMRLLLLAFLVAGCAAPGPAGEDLVDTRRELTGALTARGWYVEPVAFANELSVAATGTAYRVRRRGGDARTLLVFEAPVDDEGVPDDDALDRDLVTLRQQYAGRAAVFHLRPGLLVVTFPRGRTELDLRLAQLLGPPVAFTE